MEKCSGINILPNEMLLKIFSYLSVEDLAMHVQHVNIHWRKLAQDDLLWKDLVFDPSEKMCNEVIVHHLKNMPLLKSFKTTKKSDPTKVIETICRFCWEIESIEFNCTNVLNVDIMSNIVQRLPNIKNLSLPIHEWDKQSRDKISELLGQCWMLNTLHLDNWDNSPWTSNILKHIADGCPSLQHISLNYVYYTEDDMAYFLKKKSHQLLSLKVISVVLFPYNALAECTKLERLLLFIRVPSSPRDSEFCSLSKLTNLKHLSLYKCKKSSLHSMCDLFSNRVLNRVIKLELCFNFFLDANMLSVVLKNAPQLQHLNLSCNRNLRDDGFCEMGNCPQIRHLNVQGCGLLTNKTLEYVSASCRELKYLDISFCYQMTDDVVKHIAKCQKLQFLCMRSTQFKGTYFNLISSHLSNLVQLTVTCCEKDALKMLQESSPHLKIVGQ